MMIRLGAKSSRRRATARPTSPLPPRISAVELRSSMRTWARRSGERGEDLEFLGGERARLPGRERAETHRPELDAHEPLDEEVERLAEAAHLAVPPLGDRDGELPAAAAERPRARRR